MLTLNIAFKVVHQRNALDQDVTRVVTEVRSII